MAKFRFTGNLSPADRIERYQVSDDKVLELGGEPVTLTDAQAAKARQYIVLEELPEGASEAQFGPREAPKESKRESARSGSSSSSGGGE